jgi:hypothetical protein
MPLYEIKDKDGNVTGSIEKKSEVIYSGPPDDPGLGRVLFVIPFVCALAGLALWVVLGLGIHFLLWMTNDGPSGIAAKTGALTTCFRWASYVAVPAAVSGAVYWWFRVLSVRDTWKRIGTQCIWVVAIVIVIIVLNVIGKFLGSQIR